jgi:hypothetical protein
VPDEPRDDWDRPPNGVHIIVLLIAGWGAAALEASGRPWLTVGVLAVTMLLIWGER